MGLSKRERDRPAVLRQVQQGKPTQRAAAEQSGLSARWARKPLGRLRAEGDTGPAHRPRAKPSNNGHGATLREQASASRRSVARSGMRRLPKHCLANSPISISA